MTALPYEIIDAQVHVSAPHSEQFPWTAEARERIAPDARERFASEASSAEHLLSLMDETGVDHAILASRGVVYGSDARYAFAAAERFAGRFGVVGAFYPDMPDGAEQAECFLEQPNAVGIRMVLPAPGAERITQDACRAILAAAERGKTPLFAHLTHHPGRVADLLAVAEEFPALVIVVDHLGLHSLDEPAAQADLATLERLAGYGDVAIKWAGVAALSHQSYPFEDLWPALDRLLEAFGPRRIMWGSDITGNFARMSYAQAVDHVRTTDRLSQSDKAMILGGTARRILRWPAADGKEAMIENQTLRGSHA